MALHILRNSCAAGEFSPLLDTRGDLPKFPTGCRILRNFFPRIYGTAQRRPGMLYEGTLLGNARLIAFRPTAARQFVLELSALKMEVWDDDGSKVSGVSLTTPYLETELFEVQMKQLNNIAFFTHPNHPPYELTLTVDGSGNDSWTMVETVFDWPPMRQRNESDITVTASGTTGSVTLTFSDDVFLDSPTLNDHIGMAVEVTHRRPQVSETLALDATADSSSITVVGDYTLTTYGTWEGSLDVEVKNLNGGWDTIRSFESPADALRNIAWKATSEKPSEIRMSYTTVSHQGNPSAVLEVEDSEYTGWAEITAMTDRAICTATVKTALFGTGATDIFRLGSFSPATGYPRACTFHEQRLVFAGTNAQPNTTWLSRTNDFRWFRYGAYDDDAIGFTLSADDSSPIQSMLSHVALLIFTQSEEWALLTSEQTPVTPRNIFVRRQSRIGTAQKTPIIASDTVVLLERGEKKLRQFQYGGEQGGISDDLTALAEHLVRNGVKEYQFQVQPDPILWCVTNDGKLIAMTIDQSQNVIGWSPHVTDGLVRSVAITSGENALGDSVWVVVEREVNGSTVYYLERLDPLWLEKLEDDETTSVVYVDSAVTVDGGAPTTTFSGFSHLEGKTITGLADGAEIPAQVVTGGQIVLSTQATRVVVGLPFTSTMQPTRSELGSETGTSLGRKFLTQRCSVNVWKTLGLKVSDHPDGTFTEFLLRDYDTLMGETEPWFTGQIDDVQINADSRQSIDTTFQTDSPFPCSITAFTLKTMVDGK